MTNVTDPRRRQLVELDPGELVPALWNPRKMKRMNRARLARAILKFGVALPLTARGEDRMLIGGHQRLDVILTLRSEPETLPPHLHGLATVPVLLLYGLSDEDAKALAIVLNNAEVAGEYEYRGLTELLSELDAQGYDATLTGFDDDQLRRLLTRDPMPGTTSDLPSTPPIPGRPATPPAPPEPPREPLSSADAAGAASTHDDTLRGTSPTGTPVTCPKCHHTFRA